MTTSIDSVGKGRFTVSCHACGRLIEEGSDTDLLRHIGKNHESVCASKPQGPEA